MRQNNALPPGYELVNEYVIDGVLGRGGFGITYKAHDASLRLQVAIKEYFPEELAERTAHATMAPKSDDKVDAINWGRRRFVEEQQTIAQFKQPNIVRVSRVFEANDTAYAVLDFEPGDTLRNWLSNLGRQVSQQELDQLVMPMLGALGVVHGKGLLHRDVSPDNIIVRPDGSPVLIDFGAAKDIYSQNQVASVYAIVKHGYSPIEQYSTDVSQQGAWTDIYSLAATLYFALTGQAPPKAADRIVRDTMAPAMSLVAKGYRPTFLRAIDAALAVHHTDRPQSTDAWHAQLRDAADNIPMPGAADDKYSRPGRHDMPRSVPGQTEPPGTVRYNRPDDAQRRPLSASPANGQGPEQFGRRHSPPHIKVGLITAAILGALFLAVGAVLATVPSARSGMVALLPESLQCLLGSGTCKPDSPRTEAFEAALACLERTSGCDAVSLCLTPFVKVYGNDGTLAQDLTRKSAMSSARCTATIAPTPPVRPVPAAGPAAVPLPAVPPLTQSAALTQFEACVKAAPCNQLACRTALEKRAEGATLQQARDMIERVSVSGQTTCRSQKEASAFSELGACMEAAPCTFERECFADYETATDTATRRSRAPAIEDFRKQATTRCSAQKKP